MICEPSIYKYFTDTSERKKAIEKRACCQQTARVIMTNMNRRRKKDIIEYSQEQGTAQQSPFPDEMKRKEVTDKRRGNYPSSAAGITIAPALHNPGPCCIDHQALNHQA
jgi:hypothetical protein